MTCKPAVDCSLLQDVFDHNHDYDTLPDVLKQNALDPDISGLGVVLAFVLTAYITFLLVAVGYCFGAVPSESLGRVDRRTFKIKSRTSPVWSHVLEKVVLMFSDQQVITGIAILAAGYFKRCTISVYHYQVVVYLAWMSSSTHLVTLTVLRGYLREAPSIRTWRVVGMSLLFVMLFVALVPTGATNWSTLAVGVAPDGGSVNVTASAIVPAQCFWEEKYWAGWDSYAVASYFLLLSSYIARAGALFASSEAFSRKWLREKPGRLLKRALDSSVHYAMAGAQKRINLRKIPYIVLLATFALTLAVYDIYASFFASLIYLLLMLAFGSYQVFYPRSLIPAGMVSAENSWGFGQLIPLLLLTLPLLTVLEFYRDAEKDNAHNEKQVLTNTRNHPEGNSGLSTAETVAQVNASAESSSMRHTEEAYPKEMTSSAEVALESTAFIVPDLEDGLLQAPNSATPAQNAQIREHNGPSPFPHIDFLKSYHQDFYISKWFRWLQLLLVGWVFAITLIVILTNQGGGEEWLILGFYAVPGLLGFLLLWVPGGILWSRVFK